MATPTTAGDAEFLDYKGYRIKLVNPSTAKVGPYELPIEFTPTMSDTSPSSAPLEDKASRLSEESMRMLDAALDLRAMKERLYTPTGIIRHEGFDFPVSTNAEGVTHWQVAEGNNSVRYTYPDEVEFVKTLSGDWTFTPDQLKWLGQMVKRRKEIKAVGRQIRQSQLDDAPTSGRFMLQSGVFVPVQVDKDTGRVYARIHVGDDEDDNKYQLFPLSVDDGPEVDEAIHRAVIDAQKRRNEVFETKREAKHRADLLEREQEKKRRKWEDTKAQGFVEYGMIKVPLVQRVKGNNSSWVARVEGAGAGSGANWAGNNYVDVPFAMDSGADTHDAILQAVKVAANKRAELAKVTRESEVKDSIKCTGEVRPSRTIGEFVANWAVPDGEGLVTDIQYRKWDKPNLDTFFGIAESNYPEAQFYKKYLPVIKRETTLRDYVKAYPRRFGPGSLGSSSSSTTSSSNVAEMKGVSLHDVISSYIPKPDVVATVEEALAQKGIDSIDKLVEAAAPYAGDEYKGFITFLGLDKLLLGPKLQARRMVQAESFLRQLYKERLVNCFPSSSRR